ncbi:MAG: DNA replication/repair protein RecF [Chromatiales bacterium]|nr:DNA replication/repair protein RecF [Chromatiales bacterium]
MAGDQGTLASLRLTDFRAFEGARLALSASANVLAGGNAAGKTSLLEAIFLLGRGQSFRSARLDSLIRHGAGSLTAFVELRPGSTAQRVGIEVERGSGTTCRVDGSAATRSELATALPVQLLDPVSQELVRGPPEERRRFLDWGVFHVEQGFLESWQRYRRALDQRNAALRAGDWASVSAWDEPLATAGVGVDLLRRRAVAQLLPGVQRLSDQLLGQPAEVDYHPGWPEGVDLRQALQDSVARDRQMAGTQVGPHRADLKLRLGGRMARPTVSRGQEKLLAAALSLAQTEQVSAKLGRRVVLLVDEPAADLDQVHLGRLLGALAGAPAQLFITTLDGTRLELPTQATVFHVEHGVVRCLV